ncbi:hypothetical protein GE061_003958 [Apolygus lucorum]|uniref:Uncharacterized protein n=1 Tax=Apolygus lucorum TaxID=248454 RepID=A0A6A4IXR9_APOLU|nr:hypothetical protein GE061_003958 [Apolygus lucorum]
MRSEALSSSTTYLNIFWPHYAFHEVISILAANRHLFGSSVSRSSLFDPSIHHWNLQPKLSGAPLYLGSLYLLTSALNSSNSNQTLRNIGRGSGGSCHNPT